MSGYRALAKGLGIAISLMVGVPVAIAQGYPSKPISVLLGFGAGGSTDTLARLLGQQLSERFNTPVIVENKPGGHQTIAIQTLLSRPADGYTPYVASVSSLWPYPALPKDLS